MVSAPVGAAKPVGRGWFPLRRHALRKPTGFNAADGTRPSPDFRAPDERVAERDGNYG